ncbi:MAG: LysR family transcriptional regulator [Proteobacteria bacterium]|nr:LysR family transcriptional regulator [Pseudomonadota bacterium]
MRQLPPLNALRAFEAAARSHSFSAAAQALCVTHSAVSHQIRLLEDWLGQPVFRRHAAGIALTPAGTSLQQAASQALALLEARCEEIRQSAQTQEIVLGAPGSFLANWLIPHLEEFETAHPAIRLRLQTSAEFAELASARVDALILSGRAPWPRNIDATALVTERSGPLCAPSWPTRPTTPNALIGQPLLHTASRPQAWQDWAQTLGLEPTDFTAGRQFDHLPLMLEAAAAGLGVAIAPDLLVEREISQGRLIAPLGFQATGEVFTLCTQSARAHEAALTALREWLQQLASGERE